MAENSSCQANSPPIGTGQLSIFQKKFTRLLLFSRISGGKLWLIFLSCFWDAIKFLDFGVALFFFGCFLGVDPCFQAKVYLTFLGFGFVSASFLLVLSCFFSLFFWPIPVFALGCISLRLSSSCVPSSLFS